MGPAPMIRMVVMSVRLSINSRRSGIWAQKKGAPAARPFGRERGGPPSRAGWVLDQFSGRRNPEKRPSTGNFDRFWPGLPAAGEMDQKSRRNAQSADPAQIRRAPRREYGAAHGSADRKAEIHGRGVERERDHRGLRLDPDDAGDLSRVERPSRDAPEEDRAQHRIMRLSRHQLQGPRMQDQRAGHAGKPETCRGERAEPVGQDAAEHVTDRGGAAEHQQREADLRGVEAKAT